MTFTIPRKSRAIKMKTELKGENQIKIFRKIAENLVSRIKKHENIAGIVFLGGLVRGFADRFSDLDIIVFLAKKDKRLRMKIRRSGLEEMKRSGVDIDLEIHLLEDFRKMKWGKTTRWDFSNAQIAFDPTGKIKEVLNAKLDVPKEFWIRRIAAYGTYMKWYCCPPNDSIGTIAEAWLCRKDMVAAHYSLNYCVDLLLKVVFALNKRFLPPPKWRTHYSYRLEWLPENYNKDLAEALTIRNLSVREFNRRTRAIRELWHEVVPKIEDDTGLNLEKMSKYYAENILHQV
jgi:predicted nucleotidyltransferase